jgi:hypothetical protein
VLAPAMAACLSLSVRGVPDTPGHVMQQQVPLPARMLLLLETVHPCRSSQGQQLWRLLARASWRAGAAGWRSSGRTEDPQQRIDS